MADDILLHGARLDAAGLRRALDHMFERNAANLDRGQPATPICVWGTHGIGKTMIVEQIAAERGWRFAYCAPAQFEEMGDLHGLPVIGERDDGAAETRFAAPSWVPRDDGPGILLLDDFNRADDRILRGLMQLLQRNELVSWRLPRGWHIVATANPEGGDYSVTPLDDAMLTRLLHVSLMFEPRAWAAWARSAAVDPRGIAFVLTYPESVTGRKTTPRSLVQFFDQIASIDDLERELELVRTLGASTLDDVTVASFCAFVTDSLAVLVSPAEILESSSWKKTAKRIRDLAGDPGALRVDHLATMCTRLYLEITDPGYQLGPGHGENLVRFLLHESLPNDLRVSFHRDVVSGAAPEIAAVLRDKRLAELALAGM